MVLPKRLSWHVPSPFDEALSKPFLDEPVKKRWSLLSSTSARTEATATDDWDDDDEDGSTGGERYEAPDLEASEVEDTEVTVADDEDDEEGLSADDLKILRSLVAIQPVDADRELFEERNREFGSIRTSKYKYELVLVLL